MVPGLDQGHISGPADTSVPLVPGEPLTTRFGIDLYRDVFGET